MEYLVSQFSLDQFMPHGHCFLWQPGILWTKVISDGLIALAYYSIPLALVITVRKRKNWSSNWILIMFSLFIFACGTTHIIDIVTIWYPNYYLDAAMKSITAVISIATAIALWPIVARASRYVDEQEKDTEILNATNSELLTTMEDLKKQKSDLQHINNLSSILDVCNNYSEICNAVMKTIHHIWPETIGGIYLQGSLVDEDENSFILQTTSGECKLDASIDVNNCWSYRLGHSFPDDQLSPNIKCSAINCGVGTGTICIPVSVGGNTMALLHLKNIDYIINKNTRTTLNLLLERSGLAINNLRLHISLEYKSTRDPLTGLFNRRYMDESISLEIKRAQRCEKPLSIIMFDLDNFKALNDTKGHDEGDHALQYFADIMRNNLRECDIACRYGGEEFFLILPETGNEQAVQLANRIRISLESSFETSYIGSHFTVSAGVASLNDHGKTDKELLIAADKALYKAKENGRNCVHSLE